MSKRRAPSAPAASEVDRLLDGEDTSLLDVIDNVLNKGVVLTGDITIGLAQVDQVYQRLSLLLCAADRVLPEESADFIERHRDRHARGERPTLPGQPRRVAAKRPGA
jgi:hypothetical protein